MVDRNIEEALNLVGMKVHRDDAIDAGSRQQVGYKLGTNAHTRLVLTILTSPSEVRDNGIDGTG